MNRDELLRVATALWAAGMRTGDDAIRDAEMLIKAVDAKCAKQHSSPIRVKPEPVAWKLHHEGGHTTLVESIDELPSPLQKLPKTPLYELEDA